MRFHQQETHLLLRTQCDEMQRLAALNDGGKPPIEYWEQLMIYFDNAATTFPKPAAVIREMTKCMKEYCGNPGRGSHPLALAAAEAIYDVRCGIADFFGISKPENVFFFNDTATTEIYTLSLHDALPILLLPASPAAAIILSCPIWSTTACCARLPIFAPFAV